MNNVKEIQLPQGWEVDKIENGKIILKEVNPIDRLPNSWEECAGYITDDVIKDTFVAVSFITSVKHKEALIALSKLIILRDCYRMGWKPDWEDGSETKHIIEIYKNEFRHNNYVNTRHILAFQSKEIRDKFYNNFKDLLEQIKPLFL